MKRILLISMSIVVALTASAQIKARWGSIDVRYPLDCTTEVADCSIDRVTAWRGERVNLQLVVENGAGECTVEYRFGNLKCST